MATKNPKRKKANSHLTDPKRTRPSKVSAVIHHRSAKQSGKRAEEALQEIGERFRLAFENANIGMCLVDLQGRLTKVNHQMCEIFGYSQEELEGMTVNDIAHPEDLNISTTFIQRATSGEIEYTHFEKRYFQKDGHIVWGAVSSSLVRDPQGVPQYFISHVQDITKRKKAEEALRSERDKFRGMLSAITDGVDIVNKDYIIGFQNEFLLERFGDKRGEKCYAAYMGSEEPCNFCGIQEAIRTGKPTRIELIAPDGRNYELSSSPFTDVDGEVKVIELVRDITERKRAEEALRQESLFRSAIIDHVTEGLCVCHETVEFPHVAFTVWNHRMIEITGYTMNEINRLGWYQTMYPDPEIQARAIERMARMRQGDDMVGEEWEITRAGGEKRLLSISTSVLQTGDGIAHVLALMQDVTERKLSEEALRQSEEKYRTILENIADGYYEVDLPGNFTLFNDSVCELFGYSKDELMGMNNRQYTDAENARKLYQAFNKVYRKGKPTKEFGWEIIRKDGTKRYIEASVSLMKNKSGQPIGFCGIVRDITGRKQAEEALRESEERYRTILENIEDGYYEVDLHGDFTFFNDSLCRMLGYSRDEMLGMGNQQYTDEENRKKLFQAFNEIYRTGKSTKGFGWEVFRKDGTKLFGEVSVSLIKDSKGQPIGFRGIARDITEHKQAEEALRTERQRFRTLIENAPFGMVMIDRKGAFQYINPKFIALLGYDLKDVPDGKTWFRKAYPDPTYRQNVISTWKNDLETSGSGESRPRTFKVICKDGTEKIINFIPVQLETGENLMACEDITERKEAEEALQESEKKFRVLTETAASGIFIQHGGRFIYVNPASEAISGYTRKELLAMNFWDLVHPDFRELIKQRAQARQQGELVPSRYELKIITKNGEERWIDLTVGMINFEGKPAVLGTDFDITERKRAEEEMRALEEQLRQSQKMEAVGLLAGGIAHDFNNLLTIIKGYSQLSLLELKEGDLLKGNIEEIEKATERAANLTGQLLAFSRRQVMQMKVFDFNTLLRDLENMLRRVIGEDIELVTILADDLGRTKTDPGQIEQVIMNLAVNARDAMPSGGKLIIETANVEFDEPYAHVHIAMTLGRYVMLSVSDTGVGMTPEIRERVFEPFFTTKEKGKGTGLGLSTVYGIVKQSGGNILVYSEPGQGTTVKIYFPRVEEENDALFRRDSDSSIPQGSETVLVVEDEPTVRSLATHILRHQGYRVLEAADGEEALRVAQECFGEINLLLTDVVMPRMGGKEVADRLKTLRPSVKVLFISGFPDEAIAQHGILAPGIAFLQKPFSPAALAQKVRDVLDREVK